MLHILVDRGVVLQVCELADTPDKPPRILKLEEDYKVEQYMGYDGEPCAPRPDGWIIPKVYKGKCMHELEMEEELEKT